ncbi:MAG: hypothetical protein HFF50_05895 [Lawsonibacter sp.]|nr:hypothetical protein [Lawsonibacter sp.]
MEPEITRAAKLPGFDLLADTTSHGQDEALCSKLETILFTHFSNGFRLHSPIELRRFRSFATEDMEMEIPCSDEELRAHILDCGIICDEKVYAISSGARKSIRDTAASYFSGGAQVIFYDEFYKKNESWLFKENVVSEDILTKIVLDLFPHFFFTRTYFGTVQASIADVLEREILRVWGNDILLTYTELSERLPYIPLERIKGFLAQNHDFIWNSAETFSHLSRVEIRAEDREAIQAAAAEKCSIDGYTTFLELPLEEVRAQNDTLSISAVYSAVYRTCLQDQYDRNGKIIVRRGDTFDAVEIMKAYCRTLEQCSLKDLLQYEKDLIGETKHQIALKAGHAVMVRTGKDCFVAEQYVHFDVEKTDRMMDKMIPGEYLPLQSFSAFGILPDCGQSWNLFLLESYCRRFSQTFRFDAPAMNSKNAGAVIRRRCTMRYVEIMADAVAASGVPLENSQVCAFLYKNGYIGRKTNASVGEIIERARALYERGT